MNKVKNLLVFLAVVLISVGFISREREVPQAQANPKNVYGKIKIFAAILETIERAYVEQRDAEGLLEDAIKGMTAKLDPHTVYLPANDFKFWNQNFEGFTGIGIGFEVLRGKITVMSVLESSPAQSAGILAGDKILEINGKSATDLSKDMAIAKLNGEVGTKVRLRINRETWRRPRVTEVVRKRILHKSVPYAIMIRPRVGYIRLERFTSTTVKEMDAALERLDEQGMRQLLLDLRGNSGGYLSAAVDVVDRFVAGGHKIVYTKGRLASSYQEFYSTDEKTHNAYPLVVLIDHGSASASEIVAGAIQDLDRGLIVGESSFGKGLVQSQYRFQDGSALLVTTARYYTPSGRPIQRNFFDKSKDEYYREAYDDSSPRNIPEHAAVSYKTLLGRDVYAEGGIQPDVWIENEDNIFSFELRSLFFSEKLPFNVFVEDLTKSALLAAYSEEYFIKNFVVTDELYNAFIAFARQYNSELNPLRLDEDNDKRNIKFLLKRTIAYRRWGHKARFKVNLTRDHQVMQSLRHLQQANSLLTMASSHQ